MQNTTEIIIILTKIRQIAMTDIKKAVPPEKQEHKNTKYYMKKMYRKTREREKKKNPQTYRVMQYMLNVTRNKHYLNYVISNNLLHNVIPLQTTKQ